MSYYYKYAFVSPEPVYSTVKEELKSYFDTAAVDDLLFPTYLDKALKKLGRTTYVITDEILFVEDFQARLPDNFYAVREAWMTTEVANYPYQSANSFYSQAASETTIQMSPLTIGGTQCNNGGCQDPGCEGNCMPVLIQAVYKTNNSVARGFTHNYLLKPGNISARKNCDVFYTNNFTPGSASIDSFDIRDNKFVTNFRNGVVHLIFYATEYDETGNQLIPDNYRIREYVEAFLKFKVFETLTNQTVDETFNQLQQKLMYHKQAYEEAFIMAMIEVKKETAWEKQRKIKNDLNRFNMYELPTSRYGRRRN
ncbi:MAG: hypothetical protein JHC33_12335 [Ignisphaera sp.]|nr:hypothetical protein [Ignisphaera sp.]